MRKNKITIALLLSSVVLVVSVLLAGDHIDAPSTNGTTSDLTGFYAFEGANPNNVVLVANIQGLLPSGDATMNANFDEDVLVEFNIDTTGDLVEDLVIQAIRRGEHMHFFGPAAPGGTGLESEIMTYADEYIVPISSGETDAEAIVHTASNGMQFFAGPRDDPFFFDLNQFNAILNGEAPNGFSETGSDTFAGMNVLSVVVELPKSMLGTGTPGINPNHPNTPIFNMWIESKRKQ